ncbi:MAG: helix-turn-helix domain-containing protein [Pseudomonadota bacterium]
MKPILEVIRDGHRASSCHVFDVRLTRQPGHWHYHPELELTLVMAGEGTRFVGDHVGRFGPGDVLLTGENLPHDFNVTDENSEAHFLVIQFRPDLVSAFPELASLAGLLDRARRGVLFDGADRELADRLLALSSCPPARQLIGLLDVLCVLAERDDARLLCAHGFGPALPAGSQLSRLNQVIDFVGEHYDRAITLSDMTALTSMTAPSFCRWFRRTMDCSFFTYVNNCRVEHAARLLLATDRPVNVIARDCGFESISSFNRAFRRKTGTAPRRFRGSATL